MFRTVLTSLLAVLVLCGSAFAAEKTLIAAANPTWPPMEFLDENKNIIGYDRDIIAAIAEEIGMKSEFRNIAWDGIFASLESGQANVIASCVTITDKRKKAYVFSDPYYEVHQAVVVAKDSAIKKPEDLKGKKVGVQIGTTAIEALRKMNVDIDLRTYDEVGLVFEDMRNGRLDVVVCDDPVARYYASPPQPQGRLQGPHESRLPHRRRRVHRLRVQQGQRRTRRSGQQGPQGHPRKRQGKGHPQQVAWRIVF